ncbi:MAG: type II secretion system minor pseudopilin GspK [Pseudohongiellaceae bacterium]
MNCNDCSSCRAGDRGSALVLAMVVVALVSTLAVRFSGQFLVAATQIENRLLVTRYQHYLEGAESLAAVVLEQDGLDGDVDHSGEAWARALPPLAIDEGILRMAIQDAQGRINLNSLAQTTQWINDTGASPAIRFTPMQRHFIRLLQTFEDHPVSEYDAVLLTEAVIDWLDADQTSTGAGGAEAVYYGGGEPAYEPSDAHFRSVSELRMVRHVTPALYERLRPCLVALPQATPLNVNTMDARLLRTFNALDTLEPLEASQVQGLLQDRERQPFPSLADFLAHELVAPLDIGRQQGTTDHYSTGSSHFLLDGEVLEGGVSTGARSLLHRHDGGVSTIRRRYSVL